MVFLHDLEKLIELCRKRFDALPKGLDLKVPQSFWDMFRETYEAVGGNDQIKETSQNAFVIESGPNSSAISSRWLLYAYAFAPFSRELTRYKDKLTPILANALTGQTPDIKEKILKKLPGTNWERDVDSILPGISARINSEIQNSLSSNQLSLDYFKRFFSDRDWWGQGKTFFRGDTDWMGSSVVKAAKVIAANSDRLPAVINTAAINPTLELALRKLIKDAITNHPNQTNRTLGGRNVIFYGAPGTGKSYKIQEELQAYEETQTIRTVFHADTQTGDFVGAFKPVMVDNKLQYAFQPGPFTNALVLALNHPDKKFFLVVEEINRAPAAAVFGEIFQLLDRNIDGDSYYQISASDPAHEEYLAKSIAGWQGKMRLPSNLTLLASMNSSDQAVMPLDTAFKRRWRFEYIPVDFTKCAEGNLPLPNSSGQYVEVSWKDFATTINSFLAELEIPEDRHLGPFFLVDEEISPVADKSDINERLAPAKSALLGKLFLYLWDDVLRHGARKNIFASEIRTYGQLVSRYESRKQIFSEPMIEKLKLNIQEIFEPGSN